MSTWLDPTPPPDVRTLTDAELLALWKSARNGILGLIAAEEGMRRLARREERGRVSERG